MYRRSNFIASYAINPLKAVGYPLYHATMIDLKFPIDSMFCNLVSGQDHFSSETIDQLQLSCFQAQPSLQLAIQQFRIAVDSLASKPAEINGIESEDEEETENVELTPPVATATESFVSPFTESPLFGSDDLNSAGVGQGSMLKMLKSTSTSTSAVSVKKNELPVAAMGVTGPPVEVDAASTTSASGPFSPTSSVASDGGKTHSQSKSILGLLKGILVPTPSVVVAGGSTTVSEKIPPVTALPIATIAVVGKESAQEIVQEEEEEE